MVSKIGALIGLAILGIFFLTKPDLAKQGVAKLQDEARKLKEGRTSKDEVKSKSKTERK